MSALEHEHDDEWDTEEFQAALKIVLKYEIQSLLDRLSYTGEETVLLTANRIDNYVGHLASTNAQKFVDSKDVGDLKTKFLTFLMGPKKPMRTAGPGILQNQTIRGNIAGNQQIRGQHISQPGQQPTGAKFKGTNHDTGTLSDPEGTGRKPDTAQSVSSQLAKPGSKRPLEDTTVSKDKLTGLQPEIKRRKAETVPANQSQVTGVKPSSVAESKPANILPRTSQAQQKTEMKLNTTKVVSKSGFVEERLSQAEFQKIIQKYKHMSESEGMEDDYDDEDYDEEEEEYDEMLEEGEIRFPYMEPSQQQQQQLFQLKQMAKQHSVNVSSSSIVMNKVSNPQATGKPGENVKRLGEVSGELAKKNTQMPVVKDDRSGMVKLNSAGNNPGGKTVASVSGIKLSSEMKTADFTNSRESDGDTKKGSDQGQLKTNKIKPELKLKEDIVQERDKGGNTQSKDMKQTVSGVNQQNKRFSGNVDEMDTESLIKMVKEQHAQSQSDADKQIQAKLGQLSSKLSWVVEYPKEHAGEAQQQMPMPRIAFPPGMEGVFMDDEDDDEEDYDEEFDDDELDEQELAALAMMRKMSQNQMSGERMGHFEGVIEDEAFEEDYDQEMETFDDQHRVFNPSELMRMQEYGGEEEGQCQAGMAPYQRSSSPSLENYLLIGPSMAKCILCNKIVRKTEVQQHTDMHVQEGLGADEEEEEDENFEEEEEEEDGGEGEFHVQGEEGGDERGHDMEGEYSENVEEEYHEEDELGEDAGDEEFNMAEFTAEPLVAEKLVSANATTDLSQSKQSNKNTVCEICNKSFISLGNLTRHKKTIHSGSKQNHVCPVCDKNFRLISYLTKHIKKAHPGYKPDPKGGAATDRDEGAQDGGADEGTVEEEKSQSSN